MPCSMKTTLTHAEHAAVVADHAKPVGGDSVAGGSQQELMQPADKPKYVDAAVGY